MGAEEKVISGSCAFVAQMVGYGCSLLLYITSSDYVVIVSYPYTELFVYPYCCRVKCVRHKADL